MNEINCLLTKRCENSSVAINLYFRFCKQNRIEYLPLTLWTTSYLHFTTLPTPPDTCVPHGNIQTSFFVIVVVVVFFLFFFFCFFLLLLFLTRVADKDKSR